MIRDCTTRVRSGCLTCKRRRKKCDEGKPACRNCISTKRVCQGYVNPFREVNRVAKREISHVSSSVPDLGSLQLADASTCRDYIGFRYLSEDIIGCSGQVLIQDFIQRSLAQPTIRHALLALSTHLESFAQNHRIRNLEAARNTYSLRHYGQALAGIRQTLSNEMNKEKQIEILIAVFLIITLELVRGNGPAALAHLEGALRILSASTLALRLLTDEDNTTLAGMRALFVRLELHTLAFVGAWVPTTSMPSLDSMSDLMQYISTKEQMPVVQKICLARHSFLCLKYRSYQVMRCNDVEAHTKEAISNHRQSNRPIMIETVLADLKSWYRLFQSVLEMAISRLCKPDSPDARTALSCRLLLIHYFLLSVSLSSTGTAARETSFDTCSGSFEATIQHADAIISAKRPRLFTMDMGIIEPLYYTVLKCREPQKRLKALYLLDSCTQEAAWDGPLMAAIAKHVISVEATLVRGRKDESIACTESSLICMAENVWDFKDDPSAEAYRVYAVALHAIDWEYRTAMVEVFYADGKVDALCAAPIR